MVSGRLKYFIDAWKNLTDDKIILQYIEGYKIPFSEKIYQQKVPSLPVFTQSEFQACLRSVKELLSKGSIRECQSCEGEFISSYFLVDKPNGEKRFILNLKNLNQFIQAPHFKLEDLKTASRLITPNCYMASVDLKDAYFLVPIAEKYKKFLRFEFNEKLYEFNCLPFGLCTAPYVFTKLLKPVAQKLRSEGLLSVIYLDDILLIARSKCQCLLNVEKTKETLESLGFILNFEKSNLIPSQECKFLGFILNSVQFTIELTQDKRQKIVSLAKSFETKSRCRIRDLAQCIGVLISACPGVKYGWLYTKLLEREKFLALEKSKGNFEEFMLVSNNIKKELAWWIRNIPEIKNPIRISSFKLEIFSDASLTGWGASCDKEKAHGWWDSTEKMEHINLLELKAVFNSLKCFAKDCRSCHILLRVDNTTAISYVNRMGGIQYEKLNSLARQIWQWCEERDIWVFASYIKSKENVIADKESRILAPETEWELNDKFFHLILNSFGFFDIDLFATNANKKCERFVSWYRDPESIAIDAFTISWSNYYFYAFPPFSLVLRVLRKIIDDRAEGVIVVPFWPTQVWYPLFLKLLTKEPLFLGPQLDLLSCPSRKQHPLANKLTLVAGHLSGRLFAGKEFRKKELKL